MSAEPLLLLDPSHAYAQTQLGGTSQAFPRWRILQLLTHQMPQPKGRLANLEQDANHLKHCDTLQLKSLQVQQLVSDWGVCKVDQPAQEFQYGLLLSV
eukprot:6474401-Amphidinium_carterae.2